MTRFKITGNADNTELQIGATATPGSTGDVAFLSYNGTVELGRITSDGYFGIGTDSPDGPLHIVSNVEEAAIVQDTYNDTVVSSGDPTYQSFTTTFTGIMTAVTLRATTSVYTGTLEVRAGTGFAGTLLSSTPIILPVDTDTKVEINPCYLTTATVYSIVITGSSNIKSANDNPYAGGQSNSASNDLFFTIYMKDLTDPNEVITVDADAVKTTGVRKQNDLTTREISETLSSGSEILIETGVAGWGIVHVGDDDEYAEFLWHSGGVVTLMESTDNIADTDTASNFCIYDAGDGIALKNNLGSDKELRAVLHYSDVSSGATAPTAPTTTFTTSGGI